MIATRRAGRTTIGRVGNQVHALRRTLHERGFRMTPQRQLVLDAVEELGHATPEQICATVQRQAPSVNITTIYRTLDLLERLGMVRHTHLGHGAPNYSAHEHEHVHLVCHLCGTVAEVPTGLLDELAGRVRAEHGFRLDATHVALSGVCADCVTGADETEDEADALVETPAGPDEK
jgi:Fur family transcriptional regulator, ferric uptake regulator